MGNKEKGLSYRRIFELLRSGEPFSLVTIIRASGSTPRKAGCRMLVHDQGGCEGTVGGGVLEAAALQNAKKCLEERSSRIIHLNLDGGSSNGLPMTCGGQVDILFEYIEPDPASLELYGRASRLENEQAGFVLISDINELEKGCGRLERELVQEDRMAEVLRQRLGPGSHLGGRVPVMLAEERGLLVERMLPRESLYIFGAGHVGVETAILASNAGFRIVLLDDREEFLNSPQIRRLDIDTIILPEYAGVAEKLNLKPQSYAVIVTRGHLYDQRVLEQVLPMNLCYTGMMGSKTKRQAIYSSLLEKGFAPEDLNRVFCPVGLDIGAETPAELAVSIVAQLIQVRAAAKNDRSQD